MKSPSLDLLSTHYPGAVFLTVGETARALGVSARTVQNEIYKKQFQIPTVKRNSLRLVPIIELAKYLDALHESAALPELTPKKGRPRGTKLARGRA